MSKRKLKRRMRTLEWQIGQLQLSMANYEISVMGRFNDVHKNIEILEERSSDIDSRLVDQDVRQPLGALGLTVAGIEKSIAGHTGRIDAQRCSLEDQGRSIHRLHRRVCKLEPTTEAPHDDE